MSTTSGHYKRYLVSGKALFQAETGETTGELVDISRGGVRIRSKFKPLEGEGIAVRFTLLEYSEVFQVRGMVVGVQSDSWALMFLAVEKQGVSIDYPDNPAPLNFLLRGG